MKRKLPFYSLFTSIPIGLLILVSFTGGQPGGFSGSPGDGGSTCTACHTPGANHGGSPVLTNVPTSYMAGQVYDLNLAINGSAVSKFGFNITAESAGGTKQGTWTSNSSNGTQARSGGDGLTHNSSGTSRNNWTLRWTAPASGEGPVTFYYATIQANGAGGNSGDQMINGQSIAVLSNNEYNLSSFKLYPTHASNNITVELASTGIADVTIYNLTGQIVNKQSISDVAHLDISGLTSGTYITQVSVNGQVSTQKFIKK